MNKRSIMKDKNYLYSEPSENQAHHQCSYRHKVELFDIKWKKYEVVLFDEHNMNVH